NVARNLDIQVNNPKALLELAYIDDVLEEFLRALKGNPTITENLCVVPVTHKIELEELADRIKSFKESRKSLAVPTMSDEMTKKLYSTYLSFLPEDNFSY